MISIVEDKVVMELVDRENKVVICKAEEVIPAAAARLCSTFTRELATTHCLCWCALEPPMSTPANGQTMRSMRSTKTSQRTESVTVAQSIPATIKSLFHEAVRRMIHLQAEMVPQHRFLETATE